MPRVADVVQAATEIVSTAQGRHELVRLASALTHVYLACMAKLLETPQEQPFVHSLPPENDCRLLTMPQVADMLHVPLYTARELGRRGQLPTIHIGSRVLVSLTALRHFIQSNENGNGLHPRETRQVDTRLSRRIR